MGISESDELRAFEATGIYRLAESGAAFLDPVRILNESYRRFRLVPSAYYSRSFGPSRQGGEAETERTEKASPERKKRKRKRQRKPRELNEVERIAEARHKEARPLILSAHESLLKAKDLLESLPRMMKEDVRMLDVECNLEKNFVELGSSWRAPFCEMTLCFQKSSGENSEEGIFYRTSTPLFNSMISVEENDDAEGEFQDRRYILPRQSCFLMVPYTSQQTFFVPSSTRTCPFSWSSSSFVDYKSGKTVEVCRGGIISFLGSERSYRVLLAKEQRS